MPKPDRKAVLLRLDPSIHDALAQWAADDLRSVNAHIELQTVGGCGLGSGII